MNQNLHMQLKQRLKRSASTRTIDDKTLVVENYWVCEIPSTLINSLTSS